jgi:hypothetical protein
VGPSDFLVVGAQNGLRELGPGGGVAHGA